MRSSCSETKPSHCQAACTARREMPLQCNHDVSSDLSGSPIVFEKKKNWILMAKKQLELPSDFFFFVEFLLRTTSKCVAHPARHSVHTFSLRALSQKKSEGKTCTFPQKLRFRPNFRRPCHEPIWVSAIPEHVSCALCTQAGSRQRSLSCALAWGHGVTKGAV